MQILYFFAQGGDSENFYYKRFGKQSKPENTCYIQLSWLDGFSTMNVVKFLPRGGKRWWTEGRSAEALLNLVATESEIASGDYLFKKEENKTGREKITLWGSALKPNSLSGEFAKPLS